MANYNSKYTGAEIDERLGLVGNLSEMTKVRKWFSVTEQATKNEQYYANGKVGEAIQELGSYPWATLKLPVAEGQIYHIFCAHSSFVDGVFLVDANNIIKRIAAKKEDADAVAENEMTIEIKEGEKSLYINCRIDNGMGGTVEKFDMLGYLYFEPQKPLFQYRQSHNYLDVSTIKVGMMVNNGTIATGGGYDAYYCFENYIPVDEGEVLSLQWTSKTNDTRYWTAAYDYPYSGDYAIACVTAFDGKYNAITSAWVRSIKSYTVPQSVKFVRVTLPKNLYDNAYDFSIVKDVFDVIPYEKYGVYEIESINPDLISASARAADVIAFIPDEICCAVGRTIEIYNSQVCPLASKYHFQWDCRVGKAMKRKFSIEGTQALIGDYPLALTIYGDNLNVVFSKTVTLKIVNALSVSKSICPIGDSLTNNKYWLNEVMTLSSNKVSFVGTRDYMSGIKHEGRSGFATTSYLTETAYSYGGEGVHPFWDGTKFSWSYYKSTTGISPDAVQIYLGTNDFGIMTPREFASNIKQMVDSIRETDANIPIFLVLTICWGNQDGIGVQTSSDGFASQKGRFKYDLDVKTVNGVKTMYETMKSYTGVYFVPLTECHDSEYNFGAVETPVNPRAAQKEFLPVEAVHPQQQGYEQMADVMYSVYCRAFE